MVEHLVEYGIPAIFAVICIALLWRAFKPSARQENTSAAIYYYACAIQITVDPKMVASFRESSQKALHYADIEIEIQGIRKEFSLRDFMERLSFPSLT